MYDLLRYFEKYKNSSAVAQQELDIGVNMVSELLTEVCAKNIIIY